MFQVPYFLKRRFAVGKMSHLIVKHMKNVDELKRTSDRMARKRVIPNVTMMHIQELEEQKAQLDMKLKALYEKLKNLDSEVHTRVPFYVHASLKGLHKEVKNSINKVKKKLAEHRAEQEAAYRAAQEAARLKRIAREAARLERQKKENEALKNLNWKRRMHEILLWGAGQTE